MAAHQVTSNHSIEPITTPPARYCVAHLFAPFARHEGVNAQRLSIVLDQHTWLMTHLDCLQLELNAVAIGPDLAKSVAFVLDHDGAERPPSWPAKPTWNDRPVIHTASVSCHLAATEPHWCRVSKRWAE
jgi:hypothetical protein